MEDVKNTCTSGSLTQVKVEKGRHKGMTSAKFVKINVIVAEKKGASGMGPSSLKKYSGAYSTRNSLKRGAKLGEG